MSRTLQEPASIFDIVTFGYKQAIKNLGTVSRICWPWFAVYAAANFLLLALTDGELFFQWQEYLNSLVSLFMLCLNYVITRYACNIYWQGESTVSLSSLKLDRTFLGWAWVLSISSIYGLGAGIVALLGLVLLLVPGIAIFSYFYIWCGFFVTAYILQPEEGVWAARQLIAKILRGNFKRTAALGLLTGLLWFVFHIFPILIVSNMSTPMQYPSSISHSFWFIGLYITLDTLLKWFSLCFSFTADCFILNRYYEDLLGRQNRVFPAVANITEPSFKVTNANLG